MPLDWIHKTKNNGYMESSEQSKNIGDLGHNIFLRFPLNKFRFHFPFTKACRHNEEYINCGIAKNMHSPIFNLYLN